MAATLLSALGCLVAPVYGLAGGWQRVAAGGGRGLDRGGRGSGGRGGGGRGRSRADFAETRIFVENLSYETTWMGLKDHFLSEGFPVAFVSVSETADGESKGCGLVQFEEAEAAANAIERMTGSELDGRRINCRRDVQTAERRLQVAADPDAWKTKPWTRVPGTLDDSKKVDEAAVLDLIARRDAAREAQDFAAADGLLDELEDLDVHLNDARRQRTWWLGRRADTEGGTDGEGGASADASGGRAPYSRGRRSWYNAVGDDARAGGGDGQSGRGRSSRDSDGDYGIPPSRYPSRYSGTSFGGDGASERSGRGGASRGTFGGGRDAFRGAAGGGASLEVKRGDWQCSSCGANVFARKTECFKCGAPRGNAKGYFGPTGEDDGW